MIKYMMMLTLLVAILGGCLFGGSNSQNAANPEISWPELFVTPNWGNNNTIVYSDYGVVDISDSGSHQINANITGIWIYDFDNGNNQRIINHGYAPSLAPSCSTIAFEYQGKIMTVNVYSRAESIVMETGENHNPTWSIDGLSILFDHNHEDGNGLSIWRVNIQSGNAEMVIPTWGRGSCRYPIESAEGEIYFTYHADLGSNDYPSEVYRYNIYTQEKSRVTATAFRETKISVNVNDDVVYSEAYKSGVPTSIYQTVQSTGQTTRILYNAFWPSISPNGENLVYIAASADFPPVLVLWVYSISNGRSEMLNLRSVVN